MVDSVTQAAEANGMDLATYLQNFGYDEETFKSQIKESVETYMRERMIILTIAGKEGLKASERTTEATTEAASEEKTTATTEAKSEEKTEEKSEETTESKSEATTEAETEAAE